MITHMLELELNMRRGMTNEEIELRKYAASELGAHPSCLLADIVKERTLFRRNKPAAWKDDQGKAPSGSPAQA